MRLALGFPISPVHSSTATARTVGASFLLLSYVSGVLRAGGRGQRKQQSEAARGIRHHGIISLHRISFWGRTFLMEVNDKVADFALQTEEDKTVHLKDFSGKPVVLFFYPRADTPGCTIEACGFRDVFKKIQQAGAVVLGISRDTPKAQKKFKEKYNLPYTLLADVDEVVCKQFDVLKEKNMYGKKVIGIERTTFLIGPDQKLLKIFPKVKPEGHAEEVLAAVKAARKPMARTCEGAALVSTGLLSGSARPGRPKAAGKALVRGGDGGPHRRSRSLLRRVRPCGALFRR